MNISASVMSWARNTSYDVVGILLPGFTFVLLLLFLGIFLPGMEHFVDVSTLLGQVKSVSDKIPASWILIVLASYLIGFFLKSCGNYINENFFHARYFFFGKKQERQSYSSSNDLLYTLAIRRLNHFMKEAELEKSGLTEENRKWPIFYKIAQTVLEINQVPTKAVTYQNRYELFKSLSIGFLILATVSLLSCLILLVAVKWTYALVAVVTSILFVLFAIQSRDLYLRHWRNLGDVLIASTLVLLSTSDQSDSNKESQMEGSGE